MCPRFTRRREDFDCAHCGVSIRGNGYTNHCPACLWSRHVDIEPGDRAATCGGLMRPVAALAAGTGFIIIQQCQQCGHVWRNKSAANDRRDIVLSLFGQPVPDNRAPGRQQNQGRHRTQDRQQDQGRHQDQGHQPPPNRRRTAPERPRLSRQRGPRPPS